MTFSVDHGDGINKTLICTWTSDGSGDDSGTTTFPINGQLISGFANPGSPAPDNDHNIVLTDEYGVDLLDQCVEDLTLLHGTASVNRLFNQFIFIRLSSYPISAGPLTVTVSDAGIITNRNGVLRLTYRIAPEPGVVF